VCDGAERPRNGDPSAPLGHSGIKISNMTVSADERRRDDGYLISTDPSRLDLDVIHGFLRQAYWSRGVPRHIVKRSIEHSLPFGLYEVGGAQVGFARVVTDRAVFAYLGDVFVVPEHRGRGLGVWLVETVLAHPDLQSLRRVSLATADAHELYRRFGFGPPAAPEIHMFIEQTAEELWPNA
jgi:N-acetylglutamate synthase-like GNAT family acetyltransferase